MFNGYCGTTNSGTSCLADNSGGLPLHAEDVVSWEAAQTACTKQCEWCPRCRVISFSLKWRDCSWFTSCDLGKLKYEVQGFRTVIVSNASIDNTTEAEDMGPPAPLVPPFEATMHTAAQSRNKRVAVCMGGWLGLRIPRKGQNIVDRVLRVLSSEVFVAGTVRVRSQETNASMRSRALAALDTIEAMRPYFARVHVRTMPSIAELRNDITASGNLALLAEMSSASGQRAWLGGAAKTDKRTFLPMVTSPVFGNPAGNTLQELHYQDRCMRMVKDHEGEMRRGVLYEWVMFTRLEFTWLANHPPLSLLDHRYMWIPTGEDNGGINDRHWIAHRHDADVIFGRWPALLSPEHLRGILYDVGYRNDANCSSCTGFVSSEIFMGMVVTAHKIPVARFPAVAMLQCCRANYGGRAASSRAHCFAKKCNDILYPPVLKASHVAACTAHSSLSSDACSRVQVDHVTAT